MNIKHRNNSLTIVKGQINKPTVYYNLNLPTFSLVIEINSKPKAFYRNYFQRLAKHVISSHCIISVIVLNYL